MNLDYILKKSMNFVKKNKGLITTIGACVGVAATVYFTAKATLKVEEILKNKENDIAIKSQKKEVVKACAKPAATAALTIFCIVLTYRFGKQTEAGLLSLLAGSAAVMKEYRKQMVESGAMSPDEECDCYEAAQRALDESELPKKENYDNYILYKEELTGEFFYAEPNDISIAEIKLNRNINLGECESFWFWLQCLTDDDTFKDYEQGAKRCGWSSKGWGSEEKYGYAYVDVYQKKCVDENGREYVLIYYPFLPHVDYEDPDLNDEKTYEVTRVMKYC